MKKLKRGDVVEHKETGKLAVFLEYGGDVFMTVGLLLNTTKDDYLDNPNKWKRWVE